MVIYLAIGIGIVILIVKLTRPEPPKLDLDEIQRQQRAIAAEERRRLLDAINASNERLRQIEADIKRQEIETERLRLKYETLSNEQLRREIERRANANYIAPSNRVH